MWRSNGGNIKKGMKLSKIVILGGRNDFEKFSFAVSRDFVQEFMYIMWLDTETFISTGDFSNPSYSYLTLSNFTRYTQDDGPITMHQGI